MRVEETTRVIIEFKFDGFIPENEIDLLDLIRDDENLDSIKLDVIIEGKANKARHIIKILILDNLQQILGRIMRPVEGKS
tara:strand:- start:768 stop:1007 length:240 start_codon:yes stop_codon:yes gene_type:complete